jgi:formate-dependent nitrite reductase membrane component NrfD
VEPIILWQTKWSYSLHVPLYLFFGGLTSGIFLAAVVTDLLERKWQGAALVSKVSSYSAIVTLALAGFFLTVHLGKPERGLAFPLFFTNYDSWMTRGGWIVGVGTLLVLLYAALWYRGGAAWVRRLVGLVGLPVLLMLAVYTGLLLSRGTFVPLWSSKYLPFLFLNSGVTTGLAASGLVGLVALWFRGPQPQTAHSVVRWISMAVALFILLELFEIYNFMTYLAGSDQHAPTGEFVAPKGGAHVYQYVTHGALAPWFWWGVIGLGLTVPLLLTLVEFTLDCLTRPLRWHLALFTAPKFALVLLGGVLLRCVIVWGGDLSAPLDFPPSVWPIPPISGG